MRVLLRISSIALLVSNFSLSRKLANGKFRLPIPHWKETYTTIFKASIFALLQLNVAAYARADTFQCKSHLSFEKMEILGAGGSGDVYRNYHDPKQRNLVIKLSHENNPAAVEHECEVLNYLSARNIPNIERCITTCDYYQKNLKYEVLSPYFESNSPPVSDFMLISDETNRLDAIATFVTTNLQILFAGVVMSDLQFLLDRDTGVASINFRFFRDLAL